jgi:hypothetical protein
VRVYGETALDWQHLLGILEKSLKIILVFGSYGSYSSYGSYGSFRGRIHNTL